MTGPNPFLADLYGTGTTPDQIKVAQAQQTELEKQAADNMSEADFLGRVMAHSYAQEMGKIASGEVVTNGHQQELPSEEEFDQMAEKLAMDMLHESNVNPFTLEHYESENEKVATAHAWDEYIKEAGKARQAAESAARWVKAPIKGSKGYQARMRGYAATEGARGAPAGLKEKATAAWRSAKAHPGQVGAATAATAAGAVGAKKGVDALRKESADQQALAEAFDQALLETACEKLAAHGFELQG